jgi:hypothetical protein
LDQLDKTEPPSLPDTYLVYIAIQCIISIAENQASFVTPLFEKSADTVPPLDQRSEDVLLAIELAKTSWASLLASLTLLCLASVDDDIFGYAIHAFESFGIVVGLLGLTSYRDAYITALCRISIPGASALTADGMLAYKEVNQLSVTAGQMFLNRIINGGPFLGDRHAFCLKALISIASHLTDELDSQGWYIILETLQVADGLVTSGKMGRRDASSASLLKEDSKDAKSRVNSVIIAPNSLDNQFLNLLTMIRRLFESTKTMSNKSFKEFVVGLCRLAKESVLGNSSAGTQAVAPVGSQRVDNKVADEKSFAVNRVHDVCLINTSRLVSTSFEVWEFVIACLVEVAQASSTSVSIRNQVCQTFSEIVTASIQDVDLINDSGSNLEMKLLEPIKKLMLVDTTTPGASTDENERVIRGTWFVEIQKSGLETINKILQRSGQHLVYGWGLIFDVIRSVVSGAKKRGDFISNTAGGSFGGPTDITTAFGSVDSSGGASTKIASLVRVGFPSLQLICSDFLSLLDPNMLYECMDTLECFGSQTEDINISLTAIGLLWSVSDFVLTKRQELEKQGKTSNASSLQPLLESQQIFEHLEDIKASSATITGRPKVIVASHDNLSGPPTTKTMDALWMYLLGHLSQLCSDPRPEVRNSANQTLFRTIGMNGKRLTLDAWDECIWNVLFPLLERVKISSERVELVSRLSKDIPNDGSSTPIQGSRPGSGLPVHHSRNTSSKQWDETKVLTLTGVTTSIVNFFPVLVELGTGFDRAWCLFQDYIKAWCLGGSTEVAMAAIKSLRTLVRYPKDLPTSSDGSPGKVPANVHDRLIELWRVCWEVWENVGLGIISAADENFGDLIEPNIGSTGSLNDADLETLQLSLKVLHGPFTQETLTLYVNLFPDIYDVISSVFGLSELRKLLHVVRHLPLYHTNPSAGVMLTKLRVDMISDVDSVTPLQDAILGILLAGKVDFDSIRGAPEAIMTTIAGFIRYPFIKGQSFGGSQPGINATDTKAAVVSDTSNRGFTYMALAKKSIQLLVTLFEKHGGLSTVYSGGTFEFMITSLDMPMRAKYDCPPPGSKDSTPLWRSAANTAMTIVEMGLKRLDVFVAGQASLWNMFAC